ncbi:hypothetical protein L7F22_052715 [Adiantum nelumboides]|nr:hypothetical protein [Adiantum nelumboides]
MLLPFTSLLSTFLLFTSIQALSYRNRPSLFPRASAPDWNPKSTPYPSARRDDVSFSYQSAAANGNVTIADPYNYLEQSSDSSKEVQTFDDQQNAFFKNYLQKCKDADAIRASMKDAGHYDELGYPVAYGSKNASFYLYVRREINSDFRALYVATQAEIDQAVKNKFSPLPGRKVFDEASLDNDYNIYDQSISPDGKTLLYRVQKKSTNNLTTIHLLDISGVYEGKDAKPYPEQITGAQDDSEGWTADSKGFFYVHELLNDDGSFNQSSLMYHYVGSKVKDDIVFVKSSVGTDEDILYGYHLSTDRKNLIVFQYTDSAKPRVFATTLDEPLSAPKKWISISPGFDLELEFLANVGNEYYFLARYDNESNQVIKYKLDFSKARQVNQLTDLKDKAQLEPTVIPEDKNALIDIYTIFDYDKMLLCYTQDADRKCFVYELQTGKRVQQILPELIGSSSSLASLQTGTDIFLWSWSYNTPGQLYYIKWNKDKSSATTELAYQAKLESIDATKFTVEKRWATSKDSTKVPFHLFYRTGLVFDGSRPLMLNYYGAYRVIRLPYYNPTYMSFVHDYDAVFVAIYPRGGGEVRAEQWHKAGMLDKKQNTIDDVQAVIQYLIDNKITSKGKVIIYGQYAASTTAMSVTNQAPEGNLGVVILQDGMFDLLRFPDSSADTTAETEEYGDPQKPKDFDWLRKISPLHNVNASKQYPAILFLPGGDINQQWQARKMVAELQHDLPNNPSPLLYSTSDLKLTEEDNYVNEEVYSIAFATHVLGLQRVNH